MDIIQKSVSGAMWKAAKENYDKMTPRQKKKFIKHLFPDIKNKEGN